MSCPTDLVGIARALQLLAWALLSLHCLLPLSGLVMLERAARVRKVLFCRRVCFLILNTSLMISHIKSVYTPANPTFPFEIGARGDWLAKVDALSSTRGVHTAQCLCSKEAQCLCSKETLTKTQECYCNTSFPFNSVSPSPSNVMLV